MSKNLKIGIIGLDTSHSISFTKLLNDPDQKYHVEGGNVVVAYPGGSFDFEASYSRVERFTQDVKKNFGVEIVDSISTVAEQCDAILLESVDGRVHLNQFRQIARFSKPVFIDKPLATTYQDGRKIFELASKYNVPVMSSSALRFAQELTDILNNNEYGSIIGVDCYGPMAIESTQPGLFWYGIHTVEMLYTVLGQGCTEVKATTNDKHDVIAGIWRDGRIGTIRGNRLGNKQFGILLHREHGTQFVNIGAHPKPFYASLLEQIIVMFTSRKSIIDAEETLETMKFIEAANKSRDTNGYLVKL